MSIDSEKVIINGSVVDKKSAVMSIANKGYFFDFCVYSSLKIVQGKLFFPIFHAERIIESAKILQIKNDYNISKITKLLEKFIDANNFENAFVRMVLIGDIDGVNNADLYIYAVGSLTFYPDKLYKTGGKAITFLGERLLPKAKTKDLLLSVIAYREAKTKGALDALLVDNLGNIREGTRSNIFAIKGDKLFTPPAELALKGIAQKIVIEIAKNYMQIVRTNIHASMLDEFEEIFITNTTMNVMPISQVDDKIYNTDFIKTKDLQKRFKEYIRTYVLNNEM